MRLRIILVLTFLFLFFTSESYAIYDPRNISNNRYGIHIIDENDLDDAAKLVNSTGGDWGYVKFVIREDDRNRDKWQGVFDRMRKLHLIPIVRLATKVERGNWVKPRVEDIGSWADFLASLNWVIENRYVVLFNEPNHAKEWGGEINPEEYGWYLKEFSRRLKSKSEDFFILSAGLDASAPDTFDTMSELTFINRMITKEPDVFQFIDGFTSHSYPNPDFSGNPNAYGRGSIRTFQWEANLLSNYGIYNLPVFILETGWKHRSGLKPDYNLYTTEQVSQYYSQAFSYVWTDTNIVAITPFLLNYQAEPFDHFSWKQINSPEFYPIYEKVQSLDKTEGKPQQHVAAEILSSGFPLKLVTNSLYSLYLDLENKGQSILSGKDGWKLEVDGLPSTYDVQISNISEVEPFHRTRITINIKTPLKTGVSDYVFFLKKDNRIINQVRNRLFLIPPPSLLVQAKVWLQKLAQGSDFSVLLYDKNDRLLHELKQIEFKDGFANVENLVNIVPNQEYRLVLLKPYYLPRQVHATLKDTRTAIIFPQLLPFDPSNDGKLSGSDLGAFFKRPIETIGLFMAL